MMNGNTSGSRGLRRAGALGLVAAVAVVATACGGSGAPSSASSPSFAQELALAQCIRSHGMPGFPDPSPSGGFSLTPGILDRPQLNAAYGACRHLLPGGGPSLGQVEAQAQQGQQKALLLELKLARCMRSHGVPNFPDPTSTGLNLNGSGINPQSPQFQAAMSTCGHVVPGLHSETHSSVGTHTG
jgi:hypothetical protein